MKRMFLMVCAVSALTVSAVEDSYLYWMVDDTIYVDGTQYTGGNLTAKVVAYDARTWMPNQENNGGTFLNLYGQNSNGGPDLATSLGSVTVDGANSPYYAGIADNMHEWGWSYFIELYNDSGVFSGRSSEGLDFISAQSGEYLTGSDLRPGNYWLVSNFTMVPAPEPNSALLMLIGCAALALRRRKQIAA